MKINKRLTDIEANYLGLELRKLPPSEKHGNPKYPLSLEEFEKLNEFRGLRSSEFKEVKRTLDKNGNIVSKVEKREQKRLIDVPQNHTIKRVSTNVTTGQQWVISEPKKPIEEIQDFDFESIIKKYIKPVDNIYIPVQNDLCDFEILTISDVHIGMHPNKKGNSSLGNKWNKDNITGTLNKVIKDTLDNRRSETLIIDDLGDLLDGLNSKTTRGGHELPQSMTNEEAFDLALEFKVKLIDNLQPYYKQIMFNNICNDNHAGSFAYFVNSAFKGIIKQKYSNVEVFNYRGYISHYFVNDFCFLITHGKDEQNVKFGLPVKPNEKTIKFIDRYIKDNDLYSQSKRIILKKGDSHQMLFDMCSSYDFDYYNYPSLAPPSQWVSENFGNSKRGFVLEYFTGLENEIKPIII